MLVERIFFIVRFLSTAIFHFGVWKQPSEDCAGRGFVAAGLVQ